MTGVLGLTSFSIPCRNKLIFFRMTSQQAREITDEIISLYEVHGGAEYAGEKVSQLEHMVQAAQLAEAQGFDNETILAAFLHDIGHIAEHENEENGMNGFGIMDHEAL